MRELVRERLLAKLIDPTTVTIVRGVPGSGRSTLLRQWAAGARGLPRVLVELDPLQPTLATAVARILGRLTASGLLQNPNEHRSRLLAAGSDTERLVALNRALIATDPAFTIGLLGSDALDVGDLTALLTAGSESATRFLVTTTDSADLGEALAQASISVSRFGDKELNFTGEELREVCRLNLPGIDEPAIDALSRATFGHPGLVAIALETDRDNCLAGTVHMGRLLKALEFEPFSASPFQRFVRSAAVAPRLELDATATITGSPRARMNLHRMADLGLGRITTIAESGEQTFVWDPAVRNAVLHYRGRLTDPVPVELDAAQLAERAAAVGDWELQVSTLLAGGDLAAADRAARASMWELSTALDPGWWSQLLAVSRATLRPYRALLSLRVMLDHRAVLAPEPDQRAIKRDLIGTDRRPSERLGRLAKAAHIAVLAGELDLAAQACSHWLALAHTVEDQLTAEPSPVVVSEALLVAQALLQLDDLPEAITAADIGLAVLDADPSGRTDPRGIRRLTIRRIREASGRIIGLPVPASAEPDRPDPDLPILAVLNCLALSWQALDDQKPELAEACTRACLNRLPNALDWPILLITRVIALRQLHRDAELSFFAGTYLAAPEWRRRQFTVQRTGRLAAILDALVGTTPGDSSSAPRVGAVGPVLAVVEEYLGQLRNRPETRSPRLLELAYSLTALQALRAGDTAVAKEAFAKAYAFDPAGSMRAPLELTLATAEEIQQLLALTQDHPGFVDRTRFENALDYARIGSPPGSTTLTDRERDVLRMLARTESTEAIAAALFVSANTVKFHRANLYRKLGVRGRKQALAEALRQGLLEY